MQDKTIARGLLKDCVLNAADAARLVLEMLELLGEISQHLERRELLLLLRRVIRAGTKLVKDEEYTVSLETAIWASIEARATYLRPISLRDLRYYARRILAVKNAANLMLRHMRPGDCRMILQSAFGHRQNAYVKGRAILHSVFAYGIRQEWCDANPVTRLEVPRVQEHTIEPLTLEEVNRLREAVRNSDMELSLNLMLYSGIRPAEVARLKVEDICWNEKQVFIRPQTSKTGGGRVVPLRGCGMLPPQLRIIPRDWLRRWRQLRLAACFTQWVPDACRHTFASYHAVHFKNLPSLQLEMGHSDLNLLRTRYMRPASAEIAKAFWADAID